MSRRLTPRSIKGLNSLSYTVVGSGIQMFLVENDIFGWACLQATCFQVKGTERTTTWRLDL